MPYIILALSMLLVFNLMPLLLLLLYPTKSFQKFLGCFPRVNWHPLHAFMDIFQGCYTNGTDGTCDCRYFAAFNLLVRITMILPIDNTALSYLGQVVVAYIFGLLLAAVRPYKRKALNTWGAFIYFLFTINLLGMLFSFFGTSYSVVALYPSEVILFSYLCLLIVCKTVKTVSPRFYSRCVEKMERYINRFGRCGRKTSVGDMIERRGVKEGDEDVPDRLNNPHDYQPLLAQAT
jgi:hypothetical protein